MLLLVMTLATGTYAQRKAVPVIDAAAIPAGQQLWDLKALSKVPETQWLDQSGPVHALLYRSVDFEGHPTQVFAYYSNPDLLLGRPASKRQYPAVVLIHGGGGKAFREWVEKWAAEGYAAIAMDLAGKDGTGTRLAQAGPDQDHGAKFQKMEEANPKNVWSYQAVASAILAHSWLLARPEVDVRRTAVTGISWGGYLTCLVASLDNRFRAAAPVYGCGFYDESDVFGESLAKLSPAARQQWLAYFDPSVYLPLAQPRFLFVNGNKDRFYNVVPYHKTYGLVPAERRQLCLKPDMKHSHEAGWEPHEIRYFFEEVFHEGAPLPKVLAVATQDSTLRLKYQSPVALSRVDFYYSNDSTSTNEKRIWSVKRASLDHKTQTATCPLPKEGFKYGFFSLHDQRNILGSSAFIVH